VITAIALALVTFAADTTVPVTKGQRLDVNVHAGSVTVRTWNRDAVKVEGEPEERDQIRVRSRATSVDVETTAKYGPPGSADLVITMPVGMALDVSGVELDVTIQGCRCAMHVETVQGDVTVTGGEGTVSLQSVEGSVKLTSATGTVDVNSVNDDVEVRDVTGDVAAETVNGDITLSGMRGGNVTATTVNGDVSFDGEVRKGGTYSLTSHEGDVDFSLPPNVGATVRVNTFNGSFESDYEVTLQGRTGRSQRLTFALGGGGASIALESFNGDIRLLKPGSHGKSRGGHGD